MTVTEITASCSLNDEEESVFAEYIKNRYEGREEAKSFDTGFLENWRVIVSYAGEHSAAEAINKFVCRSRPVDFASPEGVRLEIYPSFAGEIPVICLSDTGDFEALVTNTVYKGIRPPTISKTGASFAYGKTTRFIMLSEKPYSNVPAGELGLEAQDWGERSMILRRSHECTHYYTKQHFGISENLLHDEIMADFMGIFRAFGFYKAEWFLRFMGIIKGSGDRLVHYTTGLSENVCRAVSLAAVSASENLEKWSKSAGFEAMTDEERIKAMCFMGIEGMCGMSGET